MANHKSAKKRARQNIVRNSRNRSARSAVRTAIKNFRAAAEEGVDKATLEPLFRAAQKLISMASSKGLYHKNTSSRTVSRLASLLGKASTEAAPATGTKKKATKKKAATKKKSAAKKKATKKKAASKKKATKKKK